MAVSGSVSEGNGFRLHLRVLSREGGKNDPYINPEPQMLASISFPLCQYSPNSYSLIVPCYKPVS